MQLFPLTTSRWLGPVLRSTAVSLGVASPGSNIPFPYAVTSIASSRPEVLDDNELICLSGDGHLALLKSELHEAPTVIAKHVVAFSFDEAFKFGASSLPDLTEPRQWPNCSLLCVSHQKKKLQFFRRINPDGVFSIEKENFIPEVASQVVWFGNFVCLA